jgi:hypothetical protein
MWMRAYRQTTASKDPGGKQTWVASARRKVPAGTQATRPADLDLTDIDTGHLVPGGSQ